MILEKRVYKTENPVLYTGTEYTIYRTESGFQVYSRVNRGTGMSNEYKEFHESLPEWLEKIWDKGMKV